MQGEVVRQEQHDLQLQMNGMPNLLTKYFYFAVSCLPGTKYNEETESCDECPIGHYQPEAGQAICLSCGTEKTTHQNGTSSVEDCIGKQK